MPTINPRWTRATTTRVAMAIGGWAARGSTGGNRDLANTVLAVLADAGLLLPPGTRMRNEWTVEVNTGAGWEPSPHRAHRYIATDQPSERSYLGDIDAYMRAIVRQKRKLHRTVHTGPWQPVEREATP